MNEEISHTYSVIDLFAGAGGLSYGFLQTGRFAVKAAFENNPHAQETYKKNHPDTVMFSDIRDADYEKLINDLGEIDIVIGGPPCQGFSNANRQKNHAISQNNNLVKQFVRAVTELKPKAFVMENVGMLRSDIHRFYVEKSDKHDIEVYGIPIQDSEILLLEKEYCFNEAIAIANDITKIDQFIWPESDYRCLNVIFRMRNNTEKRKKALLKYEKRLSLLAKQLLQKDDDDVITQQNRKAANGLLGYFKDKRTIKRIVEDIAPAIMIQRMLGRAKELFDNDIVVERFSNETDLIAHVSSMTVLNYIEHILSSEEYGYHLDKGILKAVEFGVPQRRERFVILGIKKRVAPKATLPKGTFTSNNYRTVKDAISDLVAIPVGYDVTNDIGAVLHDTPDEISEIGRQLRNAHTLYNHIATESTETAIERFKALEQGQNFHDLEASLKNTYSDTERTQNTIYLRLTYGEPSGTVVNVRKSMWIHPVLNRALSIREAARLQTFPDEFIFVGPKDAQYQQIGNAVPPLLANRIAEHLVKLLNVDSAATNEVRIYGKAL